MMAKKKLPPLADERPQARRWIAMSAGGRIYPTDQAHSTGFELSEAYSDTIPPMPASYGKRTEEPKPWAAWTRGARLP